MKQTWLKTTLALAVGALSSHSLANGIALNEQSASSAGTALAGRSSAAQDVTTLYGNPAGLSKLKRAEVAGGVGVIDASADLDNASAETSEGDMVPLTYIPYAFYASPLDENWHYGIGLYVPFGLVSDYEKSFGGRYKGQYSKVEVVTLQPTLSYQINDRVSVGFGPTINKIKGKLVSKLDNSAAFGTGETKVGIKGNDVGYGFNAGVLVDVTEQLAWGLTYHSKVDYTLEGRTRVTGGTGPIFSQFNGDYDGTLDITTPESVDTSVTYKLDDRWTLYGGAGWTRWSRLAAIVVENENTPSLLGLSPIAEVSEDLKWHDTWSYAIGAAYQLNPQWVLRTGFAIDPSPTDNAYRSVRIPVGNRKVFSLGAGWSPSDDLTIDVAYSYLHESKAKVDQESTELAGAEISPGFSAEYSNNANVLSTQFTYRF